MNPKLLLIVDDEEEIRTALEWFIADALPAVKVASAADPDEALRRIAAAGGAVVLVTDYNLGPGVRTGLHLAAEVRAQWADAFVVLMSGYGLNEIGTRDLSQVNAFLPKPFDGSELLAVLPPGLAGK